MEVLPMDLGCENIGPNTVTVVATDVNGNESTLEIPVNVDFVQPNLACIGDLNLTLNDGCQGLLVPSMLLRGDIECIDVFGFEIVVNDGQLAAQGYISNGVDDGGGVVRPYLNAIHGHWANNPSPAIEAASAARHAT